MTYLTPEIKKQAKEIAAKELLPEVMEWLKEDFSEDEVLADLVQAMNANYDLDGYTLARELDDYCPDAELVEILDSAGHYVSDAQRTLLAAHLLAENIQPKFPVATEVKISGRLLDSGRRKKLDPDHLYSGKILEIKRDGKYVINSIEAGHINPDDPEACGTSGIYLNWAVVEDANKDLEPGLLEWS